MVDMSNVIKFPNKKEPSTGTELSFSVVIDPEDRSMAIQDLRIPLDEWDEVSDCIKDVLRYY